MKPLSRDYKVVKQSIARLLLQKQSISAFWYLILPLTIATLLIISFWQTGVCQWLETLTYRHFLDQAPVRLTVKTGISLLAIELGISALLARWQLRYQLGVWLCLAAGWALISYQMVQVGYALPIATPVLLAGCVSIAIAITEWVRAYWMLRQSEERYAIAARGTNEGLWDWNLKTDRVYFSPRWQQMLGYDEHSLADSPQVWFDRVHPLDLVSLKMAIADHLQGLTEHFEHEYRLQHRDGTYHWMLSRGLAVRNAAGDPERVVGSQTDISQRKQTEEELWRVAFFDSLTNLPNRIGFAHHLQQAINCMQKHAMLSFAVLWLDIDCFEVINNSLGSAIGDRLLIAVAQRLRSFLPADDIVARMGGDEFAILLNHMQHSHDAIQMAERVQQVLALPFNFNDREVFLTVSVGIALGSTQYIQAEHLLRDADTAMHRAKASGRARCQIFQESMRTRMVVKLLLENDLRRLINQEADAQNQEFQLLYQPIVHLATEEIVGFEALVRWRHPEQGVLSPTTFISMAEETGLIVPMSWWILREACHQMHEWQLAFPDIDSLTINVNLSSQQFAEPELIEYIRQILREANLQGNNLKLEMTESMIMENPAAVVTVLDQIRMLGVQLAIDDFGTGYSSLSYLARFPINTLKIDRSFVSNIDVSSDSWEIVRTIHALACNLGLDVTAEGVETAEQAQQLLAMNCEYGQGFYFSQPLAADAVMDLLRQQQLKRHQPQDLSASS
ncbi:MAG: hypothetical protein Kow00121_15700 [Elainellaceae cyanobacterium]